MVAVAECFRGDGEILANPIGTIPMIGGRLARATFEPDLLMTDGEATLIANDEAVAAARRAASSRAGTRSGTMFDVVWSGQRHVMMGATQVDRYGNQNIAAIGDWAKPKAPAARLPRRARATRSTTRRATGCRNHSPGSFVEQVDMVVRRRLRPGRRAGRCARFHEIRRVVTNLGVLDFETPDHRDAAALGPPRRHRRRGRGEATGFELRRSPTTCPTTRAAHRRGAARCIREVLDPKGLRDREVPA